MHTFEGFRQKFAHWSEWIHITPQSSFCNFLTSNPEVSGGHSVVVFNDFAQNTPKSARISSSYSIETNIQLESIPCIHSNHVFNCLFGNVCLEGFRGNTFAHWSEWIHITPQSSFCNCLTSNHWSEGLLHPKAVFG